MRSYISRKSKQQDHFLISYFGKQRNAPILTYYIFITTNRPRMIGTSNERKGNKILGIDVIVTSWSSNPCDVIITQTRIFQHGCHMFLFIPDMIRANHVRNKSLCVLQFCKTESVISKQRAFQRRFDIAAPSARSIRLWYKQFEETGFPGRPRILEENFGTFFFANPTKVRLPCQPRTWDPSTNCMTCVKTRLNHATIQVLHQSTAASTWWCGPRPRLGWVEMAVGLPESPSYPGHSPFIFSLCCPLNDRRRAAHSIFKIGRLFLLFLLSCPTLALLRLLILLLLLMSGNVHPNPGPIFPCSVCAGNVTWRGKSVQCCACSKWVHLRCSQLSLSNFKLLAALTLGAAPPAVTL